MSKTMPSSTKEEKYRWIKPILDREISIKQMTKVCPFSERTLKYWLASFRRGGLDELANKSTRPKSHPDETPIRVKERIIELRKATGLCAKKLNYKLAKEKIIVSDRLIGKVLKSENLVRKYRTRKLKYRYLKLPLLAGELVEIDIKYVPKRVQGMRYYQFTAIDCASRWRYLKIYEGQYNSHAASFLKEVVRIFPYRIRAVKTDNGMCFTNRYTGYQKSADPQNPRLHPFDLLCQKLNIIHYLIDPGKPAQNGRVERSHRTDQEMFYDKRKFKTTLEWINA
jgi:transposase InsO family protein